MGGEQTGPYTEKDILAKIRQNLVPGDALVWYEGLPDWQPILSIEDFKVAFDEAAAQSGSPVTDLTAGLPMERPDDTEEEAPPAEAPLPAVPKKKRRRDDDDAFSTFATGADVQPVFKSSGSGPRVPGVSFLRGRARLIIAFAAVLGVAVGAFMFFGSDDADESQPPQASTRSNVRGGARGAGASANNAKPNAFPKNSSNPVNKNDPGTRQADLRKAQSELLLAPEKSLEILRRLILQSPDDAIGKEALDVAVGYYRSNQRPAEAGRLMLQAKRPLEAAKFFLADPPQYAEAEAATFAAFEAASGNDKRDILLQDIKLLLGPANNIELGTERIRLLEKTFPGQPHPYGYYLKKTDEKIADLFNRISFHFVQSLLGYIGTEFPAMSLTKRPIVEIVKDRDGNYRIVGKYRGDVVLNRDQLSNITFVFWLHNESWVVVDTDVTVERGRFAKEQREKIKNKAFTGALMLEFLQNIFRQKFPKNGFHEAVTAKDMAKAPNTVE